MTRRNFDPVRHLAHYRMMRRIRAFEEAAMRGLSESLVLGALHPSIGQEAVAAGVCLELGRDDVILSTHRGHGHTLAKGADPEAMMRELFGRAGGTSGGKGGSMHIADFAVGMLGANGVVAANIPIAAGAAHAIKLNRLHGEDARIAVCFFGDGAVNRGPFLEGLNWAGAFDLPIVFVCEDNGFAATTRADALTAGPGPAARFAALGPPAAELDGNAAVAVAEAAEAAVAAVRGGAGPRAIVARTYRLTGHTAADAAAYRPDAEVAERWKDDPIERLGAALGEAGIAAADLETIAGEAAREIAAAYEAARAAPWPEADAAFADVQDAGAPV